MAHVRKYLIRRYGNVHIATTKTLLGSMVLESLTKNYDKPDSSVDNTYRYSVAVPQDYYNRYGHSINRNLQQHLGLKCKHLFQEAMLEHLTLEVLNGKKVMTSLKAWLKLYNITEDDVKLESLYKVWQRYSKYLDLVPVVDKTVTRSRRQRKKK